MLFPDPKIVFISSKEAILIEDYTINIQYLGKQYSITIPKGYSWDGNTGAGPLLRFLVGLNRFGGHNFASLIHDYFYYIHIYNHLPFKLTRKYTDNLYFDGLKSIGFKGFRLWCIKIGVRFIGFFYWIT